MLVGSEYFAIAVSMPISSGFSGSSRRSIVAWPLCCAVGMAHDPRDDPVARLRAAESVDWHLTSQAEPAIHRMNPGSAAGDLDRAEEGRDATRQHLEHFARETAVG
jgi:hypothetical protein